jgi:hypothetical protein
MSFIDNDSLIDSELVSITKSYVKKDGYLDVYISKNFSKSERKYVASMVKATDSILDVDFRFTSNKKKADIRFYQKDIITGDDDVIGSATVNSKNQWNVQIKKDQSKQDKKWTTIHEFGHVLGLEHPFDGSDGDHYGSKNPWSFSAATSNHSVMAYQLGDKYPSFWTPSDYSALSSVWGFEV